MLRNYYIILMLALVLASSQAIAQDGVLDLHNNGLLYSDAVIAQLRLTVDSLHERFRNLETGAHAYYGLPQASAHVVRLQGADLAAALADMEAGLAFEDFLKRYPQTEVEEGQLVLQQRQHGGGAIFRQVLALDYGLQISAPVYRPAQAAARTWRGVKSTWKTEISWTSDRESQKDERVEAFFFLEDFRTQVLNEPYARMVAYVDALVDTSTHIYLSASRPSGYTRPRVSAKADAVLRYADRVLDPPRMLSYKAWRKLSKKEQAAHSERLRHWSATKHEQAAQILTADTVFMALLEDAIAHALLYGGTNEDFEFYVEHAYNKATALLLRRRRWVVGSCSADYGPQLHTTQIARLAAETGQWPVFIRAHLNILNDRFDRNSDGSYAEAGRKTYLKELEALGIKVPDLLIGANLRIRHPSTNHYFGDLARTARALAEAQAPQHTDARLQAMIEDEALDDYNRVLAYRLLWVYCHYLDGAGKAQVEERLHTAAKSLPAYLKPIAMALSDHEDKH